MFGSHSKNLFNNNAIMHHFKHKFEEKKSYQTNSVFRSIGLSMEYSIGTGNWNKWIEYFAYFQFLTQFLRRISMQKLLFLILANRLLIFNGIEVFARYFTAHYLLNVKQTFWFCFQKNNAIILVFHRSKLKWSKWLQISCLFFIALQLN